MTGNAWNISASLISPPGPNLEVPILGALCGNAITLSYRLRVSPPPKTCDASLPPTTAGDNVRIKGARMQQTGRGWGSAHSPPVGYICNTDGMCPVITSTPCHAAFQPSSGSGWGAASRDSCKSSLLRSPPFFVFLIGEGELIAGSNTSAECGLHMYQAQPSEISAPSSIGISRRHATPQCPSTR